MLDLKMEVYTPALDLIGFLEIQRSVIWENRAFSAGSFSVESLITSESLEMLQPENIIWIEGETAGIIEYVQEESGESGPYITVKGRTLTGILDRRVLWGLYNIKGTVPEIMNALVDDCCINPTRGDVESRKIPGLVLLDAPAGGDTIQLQATGGTLLERLETLGETYGVAFGVRFNAAVPQMEFWTRWGQDRSIHQSENNPVLYSTELDDVLSSEYTYNSQDYRNVCLVAGEGEGSDRVYVTVEEDVEPEPTPPTPPVGTYTVTLLVDPEGGGMASGGKTVQVGTSITVTATPNDNFMFSVWRENGVRVSTDRVYTFTVNSDRTLTAVFAAVVPAAKKITVVVTDQSGLQSLLNVSSLTVAGTAITAGTSTVETADDIVTVYFRLEKNISTTRDMAVNGVNIGHAGTAGNTLTTQLPATDGMTITIAFTPYVAPVPVYSITATVAPSGSGNVTGAGQYLEGATVNLAATANDGYTFTDWKESGATVHSEPNYSFTAEKNRDLVAGFEEKKASRLPEGYTELEYIQSSGTQCIITNIKPSATLKIDMDVEPTVAVSSTVRYFLASTYATSNRYYSLTASWTSNGIVGTMVANSTSTPSVVLSPNTTQRRMRLQVNQANRMISVDGSSQTFSASPAIPNMSYFYLLSYPTTATTTRLPAKLYSCQMYNGDTPLRNFVPCTNPSGEVGLYDLVSGTFYANAGTGEFTAGPAV